MQALRLRAASLWVAWQCWHLAKPILAGLYRETSPQPHAHTHKKNKHACCCPPLQEADDENGGDGAAAAALTVHLWRSEAVTAVVEVDRDANITKAGCCALHQPGEAG